MNYKFKLLAIFTLSLIGLTACSGSGCGCDSGSDEPETEVHLKKPQADNQADNNAGSETGNPNKTENGATTETDKVEDPKKPDVWDKELTKEEREKIEDIVQPFHVQGTKYTWRQLTAFKSSPQTTAADPLKEGSQNNRAGSVRDNVAAYVHGEGKFGSSGRKSLSQDKYLKETDYDIDFLKSAEIKPDEAQTYEIKDKKTDKKAGVFHFVNQTYSSYLMWKPEKAYRLDRETLNAYVTVPTNPTVFTKEQLKAKLNATYKGHLLVNKNKDSDEIHKADIELNADFSKMTMTGKITNRDDELLSGQETHGEYSSKAGDYTTFVTGSADTDYGEIQITQEELDKRKPLLRKLDISIPEVSIAQQNDTDVYFFQKRQRAGNGGLEYTDPTTNKTVQAGEISGILAGPNAEEVVGEIKMRSERASFGARAKSNP